jgi:hypothetical protein
MLKHQCAECGKKLSESAASCPKCGAVKPLSGWKKVKPLGPVIFTGIKIAMIPIAIIFLGWAYQSYSKARNEADRAAAIKPGMSFDLAARGTYACSSARLLARMQIAVSSGDRVGFANLMDQTKNIDYEYCNVKFYRPEIVDGVVDVQGMGKAVEFHNADDSSNHISHFFTPIIFVAPWNYLAPTPINQELKATDLKPGMLFNINNEKFVACRSQELLARFNLYQENMDTDNINKMLFKNDSRQSCRGNEGIFPDEQLEVVQVGKVDGMKEEVVQFREISKNIAGDFYTPIKFVNPSPAPTPSAAN